MRDLKIGDLQERWKAEEEAEAVERRKRSEMLKRISKHGECPDHKPDTSDSVGQPSPFSFQGL